MEDDEPLLFLWEDRLEIDDWRDIDSEERLFSIPESDIDWFGWETLVRLALIDEPLKLPVA